MLIKTIGRMGAAVAAHACQSHMAPATRYKPAMNHWIRMKLWPMITLALTLVACNSDIGSGFMYHEACVKESFA